MGRYPADDLRRRIEPVRARECARQSPGINGITHQVFGLFDSMFPFIPSAGLSFEF